MDRFSSELAPFQLEAISKIVGHGYEERKLHESQIVFGLGFIMNYATPEVLYPCKEPFNLPSPTIAKKDIMLLE